MGSKRMNRTRKILLEIVLWLLSLIILLPLLMVLLNSLKTSAEADIMRFTLPQNFLFNNYLTVIREGRLIRSFFNSLFIASASVVLCVLFGSMGAYVLSRRRTGINNFLYKFFLLGIIAPLPMIPLIKVLQVFKVMNSYAGLILVYMGAWIPICVFLVYGFVRTVPREMDEAAIVDGCGSITLFYRIIFPLLKPVTVTVSIIVFMWSWNDFITPLYLLNNSSKWTMPLSVYGFFGQYVSNWNLVCADMVLTILPVLIVYLLGQKFIISGMTAGAVKG